MKDIRGLGNTDDLNKHSDAFVNSSVSQKYSTQTDGLMKAHA